MATNEIISKLNELSELRRMADELNAEIDNECNSLPFTYSPSDLTMFCNNVIEKRDEYASSRKFFSRFDCEKLFNMIVQCTAEQIDGFRGALWAMYRYAQKDDFDEAEIQSMTLFLKHFEGREEPLSSDSIIRYQIHLLMENMRRHIEQIS